MNKEKAEVQETAIITVDDEAYVGQPINEEVVSSFGQTLMRMHPQGAEIGARGMYTIAQLALVTGANPLPGSNGIHAWVDKGGNLKITFGIDFWRGEGEKEGGVLWITHPRPMSDEERGEHGVLDGQDVSICCACLKRDALSLMREMKEMALPMTLREAMDIVKRIGIGVANAQEYAKVGRPKQWSADKRAETDLYRKLVPTMRRAHERAQKGEYVEQGKDWSLASYTSEHKPELKAPDDYSADDANADLVDGAPDTRPVVTEDGEIIEAEIVEETDDQQEVAQEVKAEEAPEPVEEDVEQPQVIDDSAAEELPEVQELEEELDAEVEEEAENAPLPDDEQVIYESNSVSEFNEKVLEFLPHYKENAHIHNTLIKMGYVNGLNDLPYITGRDKNEDNIYKKRMTRLQIYRGLKARVTEEE